MLSRQKSVLFLKTIWEIHLELMIYLFISLQNIINTFKKKIIYMLLYQNKYKLL